MKIKNKTKIDLGRLIIAFIFMLELPTWASCLYEVELVIHSQIISGAQCERIEPMLQTQEIWYKHFSSNPYSVQYWDGGFRRKISIRETVLREIIDACTTNEDGRPIRRIVSINRFYRQQSSTQSFPIENANLDPNIKASYLMVPITKEEVAEQMYLQEKRCQNPHRRG